MTTTHAPHRLTKPVRELARVILAGAPTNEDARASLARAGFRPAEIESLLGSRHASTPTR